ncbi:DNA glycosylase AlkZ-like family protein [Nonomuraea sp. NPDC050556]|uniref:DNA glycosylase AlkZ-like family protein n=1 Tax=Nonomuraea sp. NPDC050556 TaxID=3364369 RepID=UPI0037A0FFEF
MHELSRGEARKLAVQAQLLDAPRPTNLLDVVRQLTLVQIDPTAAIAPSADLVLWSRLGSTYSPSALTSALESRTLIELRAMIRPREDLALYRAEMAAWPGPEDPPTWRHNQATWLRSNDACRRDILKRLEASGPLTSRDLPDTCAVPWKSSGWTNNRNITQMLEFMTLSGEVAVAGRQGRERLWDLSTRIYPAATIPLAEAQSLRDSRRLHALGIARARGPECPVEPLDVGEAGDPAKIEGVRGTWRVDPTYLNRPFTGRAALLSPFDRLIHDRKRLTELFEFDYQLEIYKPAAKRRWGYFALPILYGDRLIGKLDATTEDGTLRIHRIHEDTPFTPTIRSAVQAEIDDLSRWISDAATTDAAHPRRRW